MTEELTIKVLRHFFFRLKSIRKIQLFSEIVNKRNLKTTEDFFEHLQLLLFLHDVRSFSMILTYLQETISIIEDANDIFKYLNESVNSYFTLKDHNETYNKTASKSVSFSIFRTICKLLNLKYLAKKSEFDNCAATLNTRQIFSFSFSKFIANSKRKCFVFDVSSVSEYSFKKRSGNYLQILLLTKRDLLTISSTYFWQFQCQVSFTFFFSKGNLKSELILHFLELV